MGDQPNVGNADTAVRTESDGVRRVSVSGDLVARRDEDRYEAIGRLGAGGMGFVRLCDDAQIGRHIAQKVLRPELVASDEARHRFVREARIQGQLEHPAVVPVYDLGVAADGAVYFTMKRVRGVTLEQVIAGLREGREGYDKKYSRRRLLSVFASVCLALDFAYQCGVLHRDLKPGNVMLGDFGEVYLLDWGLARLTGQRDSQSGEPLSAADTMPISALDNDAWMSLDEANAPTQSPAAGLTLPGAVLGTPGYMSPEQLAGLHGELTPASDIYALGAMLFELMCLAPLHTGATAGDLARSTRAGADARPSERYPDREVPPELEAICVKATALDPAERYASARELHDELDAYLSGERDRDKRRELAAAHAQRAENLAERVHQGEGIDTRRQALREIGRALALDPDDERTMGTLVGLLSRPPEHPPEEVEGELDRSSRRQARWAARTGTWTYAGTLLFLPLGLWVGVLDLVYLVPIYAIAAVCFGLSLYTSRARHPRMSLVALTMVLSAIMIVGVWPLFGPLILLPTVIVINTVSFAIYLDRKYRPLLLLSACLAILVPALLEATGVVAPSYELTEAGMLIRQRAIALDTYKAPLFLALVSTSVLIVGTLLVTRVKDELREAEAHLYTYAWHLREFIPPAVREPTEPTYQSRLRAKVTTADRAPRR